MITEEEIKKLNDIQLTNYFVNKAVPNTRALTEEERLYREEILERMSCKDFQNIELSILKQELIEEFKRELINGIKGSCPSLSIMITDYIKNFNLKK